MTAATSRDRTPRQVIAILAATQVLSWGSLYYGQQLAVVALFCMLFGLGNGVLTIVRGTLPQELFGRANYGAIAGALAAPSLVSKALGPLAVAALMARGATPHAVLACCWAAPAPRWRAT